MSCGAISPEEVFKTNSLRIKLQSKINIILPKALKKPKSKKNKLREIKDKKNATKEDHDNFHKDLRHYIYLLKQQKKSDFYNKVKCHEKMF